MCYWDLKHGRLLQANRTQLTITSTTAQVASGSGRRVGLIFSFANSDAPGGWTADGAGVATQHSGGFIKLFWNWDNLTTFATLLLPYGTLPIFLNIQQHGPLVTGDWWASAVGAAGGTCRMVTTEIYTNEEDSELRQ